MRLLAKFLLLLALFAPPAAAQTPEERERLDWVQQRGRLLFEIDRAAWVTTDDARERLPRDSMGKVRGWTVERDGGGFVVTYFMFGEEDVRLALYRARVENRRVVSRETFRPDAGPELTPMQRRIADARNLVPRMDAQVCAENPNVAVIPPDSLNAPMDVYVLTPQTRAGTYPFGGHSRGTFSAAGELLSKRAFMRTCFNTTVPPREQRPAMMFITHLLDPIPTEIHVFMAIWMGLPVAVGAGGRIWAVDGNAIEFVSDIPAVPRN